MNWDKNEGLRYTNHIVHAVRKQHILAPVLKWESMKGPRQGNSISEESHPQYAGQGQSNQHTEAWTEKRMQTSFYQQGVWSLGCYMGEGIASQTLFREYDSG